MRACLLLGALLSVLVAVPVQAEPRPVVFLEVADDAAALARQSEVEQELALALDGVRLERVPAPAPGFGELPLSQQLAALEPVLVDDVLAALWVDPASADPLRVQMAFAGEGGRAEIRIVQEPAGPGAAGVLALGVREILAGAVAQPPSSLEPEPPSAPTPSPHSFAADVVVGTRTPLGAGPAIQPGVILGGEHALPLGFVVGSLFDGRLGGGGDLLVQSLGGGARLGWLGGSRLRVGPFAGVTAQWHHVRRDDGVGPPPSAHDLLLRVPLGVAVRVPLDPRVVLAIHAGVDLLPRRLQVRLRSTDALLVDTGPLAISVQVGLRVRRMKNPRQAL